jgi:hypothetical protein
MSSGKPSRTGPKKPAASLSPAIGSALPNWLANLLAYGPPSWRYLPRVFFVTLVSAVGLPFQLWEGWRLRKRLKATRLADDPIFIIGHWRGGTTLLHNVICQDPQFGYITLLQALFPRSFMTTSFFRLFMRIFMPPTRPMDEMALGIDAPQEDELAMSNMMRHSLYNGWQFPWRLMDFYRRWVEFEGISRKGRDAWWREYHRLLKRATLNMGGKRLVLKNPPHTARVPELMRRYPRARFIHIYRDPFAVFLSTRHLYRTAVPPFALQKYPEAKMDRDFVQIYARMMTKFFEDEPSVPPERLFTIRYEEFVADPIPQLQAVYRQFGLDGFERARPIFQRYLESQGKYQKNRFYMSAEDRDTVMRHWGFAVRHWGYAEPDIRN